jgi:hypothetical protein
MFTYFKIIYICWLLYDIQGEDMYIIPGFTLKELSTDSVFESYAILNFNLRKPEFSCFKCTRTLDLKYKNLQVTNEMENLFSTLQNLITPTCINHGTREKRQTNWERFNPLAYADSQGIRYGMSHAIS